MSIVIRDYNNNPLKELYQWDVNQVIRISGQLFDPQPVIHFATPCSEAALVVIPSDGSTSQELIVAIPNILLQQSEPISLYFYRYTDPVNYGRNTVERITIPVNPRPRPNDYIYVDNNSQYVDISEILGRLDALEQGGSGSGGGMSNLAVIDYSSDPNAINPTAATISGLLQANKFVVLKVSDSGNTYSYYPMTHASTSGLQMYIFGIANGTELERYILMSGIWRYEKHTLLASMVMTQAPTSQTSGQVGDLIWCSSEARYYVCTGDSNGEWTWVRLLDSSDAMSIVGELPDILGGSGTPMFVPAPSIGQINCFLRSDGTWQEINTAGGSGGNQNSVSLYQATLDIATSDWTNSNGAIVYNTQLANLTTDSFVLLSHSVTDVAIGAEVTMNGYITFVAQSVPQETDHVQIGWFK